ncbi:CD209 antigen-like protein B [Ruditapes philippinarum]|uniref:CD209 antigen-like protein B n=1 Tax=Ruditapes philippinarum TaxID=129788 RepID=UPI00295ABF38|nr:CD209 antigen-like protein B [Ruditapes philippinarum]
MSFADATLRKRLTMVEKRIGFVETRMNNDNELANAMFTTLQQNYEELNNTVLHLKEQMCPKIEFVEKKREHTNKKEIVETVKHSHMLVSLGIKSEKKWTRDQVENLTIQFSKETGRVNRQLSDFTDQMNLQNSLLTKKYSEFKSELIGMNKDIKSDLQLMVTDIDNQIQVKLRQMNEAIIQNKKLMESQTHLINAQQAELEALKKEQVEVKHNLKSILICPEGWKMILENCYMYIQEKKTLSKARANCELVGGYLADIESQEENSLIIDKLGINGKSWIGYSDEEEEKQWVSFKTGRTASFTNFRKGQPDSGTLQNCVIVGYDSPMMYWNDWPCSYNESSICKKF